MMQQIDWNIQTIDNMRYKDIYRIINRVRDILYIFGFQILDANIKFTSKKDKEICNWCKTSIRSNEKHLLLSRLTVDPPERILLHGNRCSQEYLTHVLNQAKKLSGVVDTQWKSMLPSTRWRI